MAASEFQSINRLSHNSQGMTGGWEDLKGTVHLEITVDVKSGVELHRLTVLKHCSWRLALKRKKRLVQLSRTDFRHDAC